MYFTLINNIAYDTDLIIRDPENQPVELDFMSGKLITETIDNPLIYTTNARSGDILRDFLRSSFPIVSRRFLELLKGAGVDNIQAFPAIIKSDEDGTIWDNYFGINVIGMVSCADLSKSTYTEIMPGHYRFTELAIDAEKAHGLLMFRLSEHSPTIIIHRSVGRYIKENDPQKSLLGWSVGQIIQ